MRPVFHSILILLACLFAAGSYKLHAKDNLEMIDGIVMSAQAGTLVVKDEENKSHTHSVGSSAQVMVEGKMAHLEDIRTGMRAHVTLDAGEVISVSATKPTRLGAFPR
ncbi:MAG: hypothetical protein WD894_16775 [Pirellulales bacterium]